MVNYQLNCKIVIPIYRSALTDDEKISFGSIRKHLSRYGICIAAPQSLSLSGVVDKWDFVERFEDEYFSGIEGYNCLLKSSGFYSRFTTSDYILIAQLDCLILKDELEQWLARGWDYVAAPWFKEFSEVPTRGLWRVGNGGLSLRKVASYMRVLSQPVVAGSIYPRWGHYAWKPPFESLEPGLYQKVSAIHRINPLAKKHSVEEELGRFPYNEDVFWAIEAPKFDSTFRIAPAEEGLRFAFEVAPRWSLGHTKKQLPFGCHAWARYDRGFWESVLTNAV